MMPAMNYHGIASWSVANAACLCNMAPHISKPAKLMKMFVSARYGTCAFLLIRGPLSSYLDSHSPTLERWPDTLLREYSQHLIPEHVCLYAWKEPSLQFGNICCSVLAVCYSNIFHR